MDLLAVATGDHLFWLTSRAAGTAALLTSSASVCAGLAMGGRLLRGRTRDLRAVHEALSLATLVALAVHAFALLGDAYLSPSLADLLVPFAGGYMEPWNGIGILAGWAMLGLGLSYYARGRIGARRWRTLHRFTALAWLAGVVHTLGEGSDASSPWYLALCGAVVLPAVALLAVRLCPTPEPQDRPHAA
jgi:sulfoxide reductase heme-binding subunit YedZ